MSLSAKLTVLSFSFLVAGVFFVHKTYVSYEYITCWKVIIYQSCALASLSLSFIFIFILTTRKSSYCGVIELLQHLRVACMSYCSGKYEIYHLRKSWKNPCEHQEQLLMGFLKDNKNTEYGKKFRLGEMTSSREFRKRHPLTTYEHYRSYVERAMNGEKNVMTSKEPTSYVRTTGTTGQSKYYPRVDRLGTIARIWASIDAIIMENFSQLGLVQKQFFHSVALNVSKSKSGINVESILTLSPDEEYKLIVFTTPPAGYRITSLTNANYIHLLFALREPTVGVFKFMFLHFLQSMMSQLEEWWEKLVFDMEHGTINNDIQLPNDIRISLIQELKGGDRKRARDLRREFQKGFQGIMKRVWPDLKVIVAVDSTGVWTELRKKYAEGIALHSCGYGSSESILGIAPYLYRDRSSYAFFLTMTFFEFIKLEEIEQKQPRTYTIDELEIGQEYEIVISQGDGLYRYRMGDIIRIISYHDNSPVMEFMYRLGLMLNVRYEKMDQAVVKACLDAAVASWENVRLYEYAVAESKLIPDNSSIFEKDEIMPYYVIFLELEAQGRAAEENSTLTKEQMESIDRQFRQRNSDYERLRSEDAISHPRVHIVRRGTFEELKLYLIANTNATANQYKTPRKLRTEAMLQVMTQNLLS